MARRRVLPLAMDLLPPEMPEEEALRELEEGEEVQRVLPAVVSLFDLRLAHKRNKAVLLVRLQALELVRPPEEAEESPVGWSAFVAQAEAPASQAAEVLEVVVTLETTLLVAQLLRQLVGRRLGPRSARYPRMARTVRPRRQRAMHR